MFNETEKSVISRAMANIEANSCVKFRPRIESEDFDYVKIQSTLIGCYVTQVGYVENSGVHTLNLNRFGDGGPTPSCFVSIITDKTRIHNDLISKTIRVASHELLHVLGALHEQGRPDRDNDIQVLWKNIQVRTSSIHSVTLTFIMQY